MEVTRPGASPRQFRGNYGKRDFFVYENVASRFKIVFAASKSSCQLFAFDIYDTTPKGAQLFFCSCSFRVDIITTGIFDKDLFLRNSCRTAPHLPSACLGPGQ